MPLNRDLRGHFTQANGRLQTVLQLIQLILLVILLIAVVVVLSNQYTSNSCDCSTAPIVGSNDKLLTDLANTSTDTQSAVKEVSQIILAEIERRLNDTATLNRLAATTDVSSQRISDALNAIFTVTNLANVTNGAVDSSTQRLLAAIFDVANLANATNGAVDSSAQRLLAAIFDVANLANATNGAVDSSTQRLLAAIFDVANLANATNGAVDSSTQRLLAAIFDVANLANATNGAVDSSAQRLLAAIFDVANLANATNGAVDSSTQRLLAAIFDVANLANATNGAVDSSAQRLLAAIFDVANLANATNGAVDSSAQRLLAAIFDVVNLANATNGAVDSSTQRLLAAIFDTANLANATNRAVDTSAQKILTDIANLAKATNGAVDTSAQRILAAIFDVANFANATNGAVGSSTQQLLRAIFNVSNVANATSSAVESNNEKLANLISLTENLILKIGFNYENESEHLSNNTKLLNRLIDGTSASAAKLMNIVNTLSNLKRTGTSTAGVVDDILLIVEELTRLHNETANFPTSCQQIKEQQPNSPSGYYILAGTSGPYFTYCNMDTLCNVTGGWTRLAYLDMTDATQRCPSGFRLYHSGSVRACGRATSGGASCTSVTFPSNSISYSQVCGRVTGYQFGSTDAFAGPSDDPDSHYVDGVSITHGNSRHHVWTFVANLFDTSPFRPDLNCPCATGSPQTAPVFVSNHYFCESGNDNYDHPSILYTSDPLWDGQGCGPIEGTCCAAPGLPWFHRDFNTPTTDYIELRICGDQSTPDEDNPVSFYDIYVK